MFLKKSMFNQILILLYSNIQGSGQPLESKILKETKPNDGNQDKSNQNASIIEIEDIGEDLQADHFINLDENGQPVKNDDAELLFNWTDNEASGTTEVQTER